MRAGALRGRIVYFAVLDSMGSTIAALDAPTRYAPPSVADIAGSILYWVMVAGGLLLARRNLRQGRVDHRGAFRLALFVFVVTALETVFTFSIPERGIVALIDSLVIGRALGHALLHAGQMWLFYVALEPHVRRLWPRMLVSWARLS